MSNKDYLQKGFDKTLSHAIEECGEFLTAAGKLQRWGSLSVNPIYREAPDGSRGECNGRWLWREMLDLEDVLKRLKQEMIAEHDTGRFEMNPDGTWRDD